MENSRLLMLDFVFIVHRSITVSFLSSMLCLTVEECKEWIQLLIAKQSVDLTLKGDCIAVNHTAPSL